MATTHINITFIGVIYINIYYSLIELCVLTMMPHAPRWWHGMWCVEAVCIWLALPVYARPHSQRLVAILRTPPLPAAEERTVCSSGLPNKFWTGPQPPRSRHGKLFTCVAEMRMTCSGVICCCSPYCNVKLTWLWEARCLVLWPAWLHGGPPEFAERRVLPTKQLPGGML